MDKETHLLVVASHDFDSSTKMGGTKLNMQDNTPVDRVGA